MLSARLVKILIGFILLLSIAVIGFFVLTKAPPQNVTCDKFLYTPTGISDCGLARSDDQEKIYSVIGKVVKHNNKYLDLRTKDSRGGVIIQRFSYPTLEYKVSLTGVPEGNFLETDPITWRSDLYSPRETRLLLSEDQEIIAIVTTFSKEEAEKINGLSNKETSCLPYNAYFIKYLQEPNSKNRTNLLLWKYLRGCSVLILQIYYIW